MTREQKMERDRRIRDFDKRNGIKHEWIPIQFDAKTTAEINANRKIRSSWWRWRLFLIRQLFA